MAASANLSRPISSIRSLMGVRASALIISATWAGRAVLISGTLPDASPVVHLV